jgi:hypothetical protein
MLVAKQDLSTILFSAISNSYLNIFLNSLYVFSVYKFDSIEAATRARDNLNQCDIYSGCCTLKIDYAKVGIFSFTIVFKIIVALDQVRKFVNLRPKNFLNWISR